MWLFILYTLFPCQMPQRVFSHPSRSVPTLAKHSSLSQEPEANARIWSLKEGNSSVLHERVFSLSLQRSVITHLLSWQGSPLWFGQLK